MLIYWFSIGFGASVAAVFFVYLFCFFTPIGFLGANFFYHPEVAPIVLRIAMTSISTANYWLWNSAAMCFLIQLEIWICLVDHLI
jgi:hypothetical protein